MPATKPNMESLNTNIRIAAEAPNPANRLAGDLFTIIAIITIMNKILIDWGIDPKVADRFDETIIALLMIAIAIGLDRQSSLLLSKHIFQ